MEIDITTIVNQLYEKGGVEFIKDTLFSKGFIVKVVSFFAHTVLENKVILIFYRNHTQLWEKWAIQSRGVILMCDESNRWRPIKYMFDRGAELLTQLHKQAGIDETENMTSTNISVFNPTQQIIMKKMMLNTEIDGYLTMKVDGMLVAITLYSGYLGKIIGDTIENGADEFAKTVLHLAKELGCEFVPVFSTQRTFNITDVDTLGYIVTSFCVGMNLISMEELQKLTPDLTATTIMELYGKYVIGRIKLLYDRIALKKDSITLSFEAVCQNRTSAWGVCYHDLAVCYKNTFVRILSYSYDLITVPHFLFSNLLTGTGIEEPFCWRISHSSQITSMLDDLSKFIVGQMTQVEFLQKYIPMNTSTNCLDPEGFVFWAFDGTSYIYSKIKTIMYYECHNPENIQQLLRIAKCTCLFPSATETARFFNELKNKLLCVCHGIRYVLNQPYNHSLINNQVCGMVLADKLPFQYLFDSLSDSAKRAYVTLDTNKKCLMLTNSDGWYSVCIKLFTFTFPELARNSDEDLGKNLKNIIHLIRPWNDASNLDKVIENIISQLGAYITKFYNIILECQKNKSYAGFYAFNIFGCPESTDIDILVAVSDRTHVQKPINMDQLKKQLVALGYDTKREIDVNVIFVEDGNIEVTSKGAGETQNMLYETYKYHKQAYPCLVSRKIKVDIKEKFLATVKFIIDNLKILIGIIEYQVERDNRKKSYVTQTSRINYVLSIINKIKFIDTPQWRDVMKSLTIKVIQLMLGEKSEIVYTKNELAVEFDKFYPGTYQNVLWLLFRGKKGIYNENCTKIILDQFIQSAHTNSPDELKWIRLPLDLTLNPTQLQNILISEFIKSPFQPTDVFVTNFNGVCPDRNINGVFQIHCENTNLLPKEILEHCILIPQRSKEWIELLTYYTCGKGNGVIPYTGLRWVEFYYNLIRGCIIELSVIKNCDFSKIIGEKYNGVTVGMLVEDKKKGSLGIAPDLLLVTRSGRIIPVEIKCIDGKPVDNHDYRRAVHLATKQLESAIKIIGGINMAILVIVYVYINEKNEVVYDCQASILSF